MSELGDKILALRAAGKTYSQIIGETGAAKSTVSYYCGAGQREANIVRQRDRRNATRKYIQDIKQASPCADCGENYPYWVMDFDHVRGTKKFNISVYQKEVGSLRLLKEEIEKCDLVCSNCHRDRTHLRLIKHGGDTLDVSEHYTN